MPDFIIPGEVWLVGAGPGDPELLTLKAARLITAASIVFHDALVGPAILDLIPADVRRVPVGKRAGRHSQSQHAINDLLVCAALAGERVVRLKGGDPSVFGRSAEEMDALAAHGIAYRICPGVTTASAAAASAQMSLTLRGVARQVRFLTAQSCDHEMSGPDWAVLADGSTTLAIYMGRSAAARISHNLMTYGLAADTPVLIASNVSLPSEQIVRTRLDLLALAIDGDTDAGPALILIGKAIGSKTAVFKAVRRTIQNCAA
jgi:uroporphyrin-III C-methyltransferase